MNQTQPPAARADRRVPVWTAALVLAVLATPHCSDGGPNGAGVGGVPDEEDGVSDTTVADTQLDGAEGDGTDTVSADSELTSHDGGGDGPVVDAGPRPCGVGDETLDEAGLEA